MSKLDEYVDDAEQNNLASKTIDKTKETAKETAKDAAKKGTKKAINKGKQLAKKAGKKVASKAASTKVGKMAIQGAKAVAPVVQGVVGFLIGTPVGWACSAMIIFTIVTMANSGALNYLNQTTSTNTQLMSPSGLTSDGIILLASDCPTVRRGTVTDVDVDAQELESAQALYSVFRSYGLNDEAVAGILGNLSVESGIDATVIEGIYSEPYQIGDKKQQAINNFDAYTRGPLSRLYDGSGTDYTQNSGYTATDGKKYPGLGLVQWTGTNAMNLLSAANSTASVWYSLEFQLAYMVSDTQYRAGFFSTWKEELPTDPREAAEYFADKYEGNTSLAQTSRKDKAEYWYGLMSSWEFDKSFAESIVALSGSMGGEASDFQMGTSIDSCGTVSRYDNSSLATAAVSYAYPRQEQGNNNNGTSLFRTIHDGLVGLGSADNNPYMSCDIAVSAAVLWSGTDDDFPKYGTYTQLTYLDTSPKWESLGMAGTLTMEDLLPGDIFILDGHVFMYVGTETVQKIHGASAASTSDSVSGSLGTRSPGCGSDATSIIDRGGEDWEGRGQYEVFRCIDPDESNTYKHLGASGSYE